MHALLLALGCAGLVCAVLCLGAVDDGAIVRGRVCFCRDLSSNSLSGTIPSQFGLLTAMTGQLCAHSFLETPPNNGLFGQREAFQDW